MGMNDIYIKHYTKHSKNRKYEKFVPNMIETLIKNGYVYDTKSDMYYNDGKKGRWEKVELKEAIKILSQYGGLISFEQPFFITLRIDNTISEGLENLFKVSLSTYQGNFKQDKDRSFDECVKNAQKLIDFAKNVWNSLNNPLYGIGEQEWYTQHPEYIPKENDILNGQIKANSYWLNFYGKDIIKKIGKENLLNPPANAEINKKQQYKKEELKNGLLVITNPLPEVLMPLTKEGQ